MRRTSSVGAGARAVASAAAADNGLQHRRAVACHTLLVAVLAAVAAARLPYRAAAERHVAAADEHICVIQTGGVAACFGSNPFISKLVSPLDVVFHAVTAGGDFSCGLAVNGSLLCWGTIPGGARPPANVFFVDAHAGPRHVCGLVPNGTVLCYGDASSRGAINVPRDVAFQGVTSGANYTCGVARNHSVVCWGDTANPVVANASVWQSITDAEHVACGADHACYVRVNGSVACWGSNARGGAAPPEALITNGSVWWLAAGAGMTCALSGSSVPAPVTCWGAVNGTIAAAGSEVACAGWGCVASTANATGGGNGRVVVAAAAGGLPLPRSVGNGGRAVVATLAGNGTAGPGYADGVGSAARFNNPQCVSLDGAGGLYVAEMSNNVIRRVDIATRVVTTVAGVAGSSGRDVGATPLQSRFMNPRGVEADGAGNVYVADTGNHAIRMLSGAWVAGSTSGASGSTNNAAGTSATFNSPFAVRADVTGGLLYVADSSNGQIRTIAIAGSHTVATLATFVWIVYDIALNPAARVVYVAVGNSVYVVTYAGASTLLAGVADTSGYVDGTGSGARFSYIYGLVLDADAAVLYVSEVSNNRIRRVTTTGRVVTTVAGSGTAAWIDGIGTAAAFRGPRGIALDLDSGAIYVSDNANHVIRLLQFPQPAPITLIPAPLPPLPLASTHQLTAWRALGTASNSSSDAWPLLDARAATFTSQLSAANTAALNPVTRTLLLGTVTLVQRNATLAAAGNTNTTFSTSAQRSLRSLSLATTAVPAAALALPALTNLTLTAPTSAQQVRLTAGSFDGLSTLTCVNCAGAVGLANLSGILFGTFLTQSPALPYITSLDASATGITAVYEHDYDGLPLRWLSVADNNLTYVSDASFSVSKQPTLATVDQLRTLLVTGGGCPSTMYLRTYNLAASGNPYYACTACPAGSSCVGGVGAPVPCGANTHSTGGAAACLPCPAGTYAIGAAVSCTTCPPGLAAPGCNASASWRDSITLVADGAGAWVNARIHLALSTKANVSCSPVIAVATTTVSCALPFLLPAAGSTPVLTTVWVAHAGTGGIPQRLNANVTLLPSSLVALAPGGSDGLSPLTAGGGRIVLRLPASRLTTADWTAAGLQTPPQATIDNLVVWLAGAACGEPAWVSSTTLSCAIPAIDGVDIPVVVRLADLFNVSGVLPSVITPPTLMVSSTDMTLLPPPDSSTSIINITLTGTVLCVGQRARLTVAYVGGLRCGSLQCIAGRSDATLCICWNVTAAAAAGLLQYSHPTNLLNATAVWANRATPLVACEACISLVTRPVLASISPTSIAAAGVPVVVAGTGIMDATHTPPTVYIGGALCGSVAVLSQTVVQCNTPSAQPSATGYPAVAVVVVNAAGAASTELINLTYPTTFAVLWESTSLHIALPGGVLSPAPTLRVLSWQAATCSLTINVSSCATTNPALAARPAGMTVSSPATALTVRATGSGGGSSIVPTDLMLDALTVSGASGCVGSLTASCIDNVGQIASTAEQRNPSVVLTGWRADWNTSSVPQPFTVVPGELPVLTAVFALVGGGGGDTSAIAASLSCLALLLPVSVTPPPLNKSLDLVSPRDMLSSSTAAAVVILNASFAGISFTGVTASTARLGQALALYAECTWLPTGERVRLPPLSLSTVQLALGWVTPPSTVLGYTTLPLRLAVITVTPATAAAMTATTSECDVLLVNATVRSARLGAGDPWTLAIFAGAPAGTTVRTTTNTTIEAAPATTVFIRATCVVWGQTLESPPLRLTTATLNLHLVSALPTSFIASDASSAWPVEPQLAVVVVAVTDSSTGAGSTMNVTDVTCSLSTTTTSVELKVAGSSASSALLSIPAHPTTGVATVPRFYVQTTTTTPSVDLVIECRRTSGDAPPPLYLTIPATLLTAQLCTQPARDSFVGTALPTFAVGIVATPPGAPPTTPCATTASLPPFALPAIVCTIGLNASATTTNDTANIFLQHTIAASSTWFHRAVFDAFTVVAPQGEMYGLALTCAVGGLAIPPTLPFTVTLAGCAPGQESQGVTCVTCGGTSFSLGGVGARCTGCPPAGAVCNIGIITLLPHYFRPAGQAGEPLGPTTELHPCYNAEACTLAYGGSNASSGVAAYGCAYGYTGPLCGVCNADVNYARFGEACAVCWDAGASWLFLLVVVTIVLAVLTRVALRKDSSRSDASIVLRITLGYLQAVGSLRVFRAGSTKAYDNVMGWTGVVSASPLSVGALQCILRLPYLLQYVATILLPVFAAGAVVIIFHAATTGRSVHCKPRCSMDTVAFKAAVGTWWASKRHMSTGLFVLFLAYMPIVSASLRALDCIEPVAGVKYLRSDLRVECGVGQHAAARALAYIVLIVLGAGFPVGLAWLLGTARNDQLVDPAFHATWGFFFDGYRAPMRTLVTPLPHTGTGAGSDKLGKVNAWGPLKATNGLVGSSGDGCAGTDGKLAPPTGRRPSASTGGARGGRRRSTLVPERLTQSWVVSGDSRVWWEAIVLCRKAGVVLLAVTLTNPYLQCVGATLWFQAALILQLRYAPYTKPLFNRLETACLAVTLLTAVISTALLQYNVGVATADLHPPDAMTGIEWAVTVLLALMNVCTFVVLAGLWLRAQCARARGIMHRASFVTALAGRVGGMRASLARRRISGADTPPVRVLAPGPVTGLLPAAPSDGVTINPLRAAPKPRVSSAPVPVARVWLPVPPAGGINSTGTGTGDTVMSVPGVDAGCGHVLRPALAPEGEGPGAAPAPVTDAAAGTAAARAVGFTATPVSRRGIR